jgi:hypothetical protein
MNLRPPNEVRGYLNLVLHGTSRYLRDITSYTEEEMDKLIEDNTS